MNRAVPSHVPDEPVRKGRLARSAGLVSGLTFVSRIFGLVRDAVVAALFSKADTDAFYIAFTIPNVLRRLLAEGALTVAFIPVFTDYRALDGNDATRGRSREFLRAMLGVLMVILVVVTALGVIFAPQLTAAFAYGFREDSARFPLAVLLLRVMFGFLITVALAALAMGVLNATHHFAAPAAAPIALNCGIVGTALVAGPLLRAAGYPPILAVGFGVLVGGALQLLIQCPPVARRGYLVGPTFDFRHEGVRRVLWLMAPSLFGLAVYELYIIIARQFASFLSAGAISYLYYAQRLLEFPLGVFAVAMATVTMPELSRRVTAGDMSGVRATFAYALRNLLFILLPAATGLFALSKPLVSVLFQRGAFTPEMTRQTARAVQGYALALCGAGGVRQTVPVFHSMKDMRTPVKISAVSLVVYTITAWWFSRSYGVFGLALAAALSSTINFALLIVMLRKTLGRLGLRAILPTVSRSLPAALLSGAAAYVVSGQTTWDSADTGFFTRVTYLLLAIITAIAVYVVVTAVSRARELNELKAVIRR